MECIKYYKIDSVLNK